MLDCSASSIRRVAEYNLDWPNLDAIWISHFHLDHVGGLAPFLAATKHSETMHERTKPLRIYGPAGIRRLIDLFNDANNYRLYTQPFDVDILEVEALSSFEILPEIEAVTMSTPHTEESRAIHIREDEKVLVYTSDTGFSETVSAFGKGSDLFVTECSYLKDKPVEKHLEMAEAMHLVRRAGPKKAMLTHFYPAWDEIDFEKEVKKFSPLCEVIGAVDGLELTI
jgi:ribonuclease BN (tRNA processing enzyme)